MNATALSFEHYRNTDHACRVLAGSLVSALSAVNVALYVLNVALAVLS